jgi:hypothetical protein
VKNVRFSHARLKAIRYFHRGSERDPRQFPSKRMIELMLDDGQIIRTCEGPDFLDQIELSPKGRCDLMAKRKDGPCPPRRKHVYTSYRTYGGSFGK